MALRVETACAPKSGNAPDEYEDAFAVQPVSGRRPFRCAIADGATETSFSGLWAESLVSAFCSGHLGARGWTASLEPLQTQWWDYVRKRPLPWYAEEKIRSGAFAALAGLTVRPDGTGGARWTALAVGDSCVLQIHEGEIVSAFPIAAVADFGRSPRLISSNAAANVGVRPVMRSGLAAPGDTFLLATDALACTLLTVAADPGRLMTTLDALSPIEFDLTIATLRQQREVRNDDVTLVRVTLE